MIWTILLCILTFISIVNTVFLILLVAKKGVAFDFSNEDQTVRSLNSQLQQAQKNLK